MAHKINEIDIHSTKSNPQIICHDHNYHYVFKIFARPSKSDHIAHIVGYCSTKELAQKSIGNGSSYDSDDNCTWYYSIDECNIATLSENDLLNIDKLPAHFPYYGW